MEAVYGWVKNIIYYMIFLSVVNNLLADSKYGKYIRFFSGMVLILLVVSPFTGGLHLDEQISSMFKSISFQNDTDDLKQDLWGMEERRLDQMCIRDSHVPDRHYGFQLYPADFVGRRAGHPPCHGNYNSNTDRGNPGFDHIPGGQKV